MSDVKTQIIPIEKNEAELMQIADITRKELRDAYNITIDNAAGIPTIVHAVFKNLFAYVADSNDEDIDINFTELMGVCKEEGALTTYPGPETKLYLKSDDKTEE